MPTKPALLGKKLVQRYFRGANYLEIDLHVGSRSAALLLLLLLILHTATTTTATYFSCLPIILLDPYHKLSFYCYYYFSTIASQIVGLCRGSAKHFAADVGIVIQGEDEAELPEKMLGCVSFHKIELEVRRKLD